MDYQQSGTISELNSSIEKKERTPANNHMTANYNNFGNVDLDANSYFNHGDSPE